MQYSFKLPVTFAHQLSLLWVAGGAFFQFGAHLAVTDNYFSKVSRESIPSAPTAFMLQLAHKGRESTYLKHCFCLYWEQAHGVYLPQYNNRSPPVTTVSYFRTLEPHISSLACSPLGWWPQPATHFAGQVAVVGSIMLTRAFRAFPPLL